MLASISGLPFPQNKMLLETDFIVVGSGIAGLRAALEIAETGARVVVLTTDRAHDSTSESDAVGVAGLRAAREIAETGARVVVLTKDRANESNTEYAQGGVAVALSEDDEAALHEDDTE